MKPSILDTSTRRFQQQAIRAHGVSAVELAREKSFTSMFLINHAGEQAIRLSIKPKDIVDNSASGREGQCGERLQLYAGKILTRLNGSRHEGCTILWQGEQYILDQTYDESQ